MTDCVGFKNARDVLRKELISEGFEEWEVPAKPHSPKIDMRSKTSILSNLIVGGTDGIPRMYKSSEKYSASATTAACNANEKAAAELSAGCSEETKRDMLEMTMMSNDRIHQRHEVGSAVKFVVGALALAGAVGSTAYFLSRKD